MLKFIARINVKAGHEEMAADALRECAGPSRAEAGCIMYHTCRAKGNPAELVVLEEWESEAALDAHTKTPHFVGFVRKTKGALDGDIQLEFLELL